MTYPELTLHNFIGFFETIKRHTYNTEKEYLYDEMLQRFFSCINMLKKLSKQKTTNFFVKFLIYKQIEKL